MQPTKLVQIRSYNNPKSRSAIQRSSLEQMHIPVFTNVNVLVNLMNSKKSSDNA